MKLETFRKWTLFGVITTAGFLAVGCQGKNYASSTTSGCGTLCNTQTTSATTYGPMAFTTTPKPLGLTAPTTAETFSKPVTFTWQLNSQVISLGGVMPAYPAGTTLSVQVEVFTSTGSQNYVILNPTVTSVGAPVTIGDIQFYINGSLWQDPTWVTLNSVVPANSMAFPLVSSGSEIIGETTISATDTIAVGLGILQ